MFRGRLNAVLLVALTAAAAHAHKPSDSYLRIDTGSKGFAAEWDIALRDLELLVGLDGDQNGEITWGEVKSKQRAIAAHALSQLSITAGDEPIELRVAEMKVTEHSDGVYAVLSLERETEDPSEPLGGELRLAYQLLFDIDPTHRGLVLLTQGDATSTHILSPEKPSVVLNAADASPWHTFVDYVGEGVWHIWIGFDHILFLISLLLPAVLVWKEKTWEGVESFRPACGGVLRIVTMFTLAHSITLWLSVMEYVTLPSQWVEATIALSIIVTAVSNLYPSLPLSGWKVALVFGLIHGFGFANVLIDLGLSSTSLALALLGFNVGVELGQIAIVLAFLPIAYLLRNTGFYKWVVLRAGSVLIMLIAAIWFYERVFNAEILGF